MGTAPSGKKKKKSKFVPPFESYSNTSCGQSLKQAKGSITGLALKYSGGRGTMTVGGMIINSTTNTGSTTNDLILIEGPKLLDSSDLQKNFDRNFNLGSYSIANQALTGTAITRPPISIEPENFCTSISTTSANTTTTTGFNTNSS